ncbi:hypothetical protein QAD02_010984 [Eretmocerus hayati]|uniref:Uncharacterized protein n=1 Tax=Eretmocerus hayati TaxID=131215 RepID=A0ACC2NWG4_9HYME|nr:hypothetical protein QAD02_010984 [Eretmocerus hayati]
MGLLTTVPILLMLVASFTTNAEALERIEFTKELAISPFDEKNPTFYDDMVLSDGSFPYIKCNYDKSSGPVKCELRVVNLSNSEEKHIFEFEPSKNRKTLKILSVRFSSNGIFCLTAEIDGSLPKKPWYRYFETNPTEIHLSGFSFDFASKNVFKLALPTDLQLNDHFIGLISNSSEIEILLSHHPICGDLNQCKLTFNNQGQQRGQPKEFPIEYKKMRSVSKQVKSEDRGLFTIGTTTDDKHFYKFSYINARGDRVIERIFGDFQNQPLISNTRNLYGVCQPLDEGLLNCIQYDWKMNLTSTAQIRPNEILNNIEASTVVSFANFDNSTFLLTVLNCGKNQTSKCKTAEVLKVDSRGILVNRILVFEDLNFTSSLSGLSAVAEIGDKFCFYLYCSNYNLMNPSKRLYVKCVPISDF